MRKKHWFLAIAWMTLLAATVFAFSTEKLQGGLSTETISNAPFQAFLVVPTPEAEIGVLQQELQQLDSTASFQRLGTVFVVQLSGQQVLELTENLFVQNIWPDLKVEAIDEQALQQINASKAWNKNYFGDNTKIAILDTGIDASHSAFQNRIIGAKNFSDSATVTDLHGHGTHVAGIAAGYGDANGVAPHAFLLNGKVLNDQGAGTFTTVINGINWAAEEGAHVINLSLGAPSHDTDTPLNRAVRDAMNAGIVVAVASGNCWSECASGSCGSFRGVTLPGNTREALTVGAVTKQNEHACFSSGETISGVGIKPDLVAPGVGIFSSVPGGGLGAKSGTSMATPFAAGAAALAKQAHPSFSALQIKALLQNIAIDLGEKGKDILFGSGLLDLSEIDSNNTKGEDQNKWKSDENRHGDVNGFEENFFFWGPSELVKNEDGNFDVEHRGQGFSSLFMVQDLNYKDTVVEFVFEDEFGTIVDYNTVGPVELVDINKYNFLSIFTPQRVGNFVVKAFIYQEGQLLQGLSGKDSGIGTATVQKNVLVTLPPDLLDIRPFSVPQKIQKGEPFSLRVTVDNNGNLDTNAFLEIRFINDQNNVAEVFDTNQQPILAHQQAIFEIREPVWIPGGDYNIVATVFFENQQKTVRHPSHVTIGPVLEIQSLNVPPNVIANSVVPVSVSVYNAGSFEIQPFVFGFLLDGNQIAESFFDSNVALASKQSREIQWNWIAKQPAKQYRFLVIAGTEDANQFQEKNVEIVDQNAPVIETPFFAATIWKNGFVPVRVRITDFSSIQSVVLKSDSNEWRMHKQQGLDFNAEFSGAVENTLETGEHFFSIIACDAFNNCTESENHTYRFMVESLPEKCQNRLALLVKDNDGVSSKPLGQEWIANAPQAIPCALEWSTAELGTPSLNTLLRFQPVIWSTGNFFSPSLDQNESLLLNQFVQKGGRLLAEGSDVSSEHGFDEFAYNVLHGEFALEIGQDENFGNDQNNENRGPWWDTAYAYKRCLDITANQTGMDTNTVIDVSVNDLNLAHLFLQGKTRADFADVRAVYNDTAQIDRAIHTRFLQDLNASNYTDFNRLSFKLQTAIPDENTSTGEYCIYYGNPTAISPPQDYSNVFVAGDSFNRPNNASLGSQWNETFASNDIFSVDNNMLKLDTDAGGGNGCAQFLAPYLTNDSVVQWNTHQTGTSNNLPYMKTVQNTDSGYPIGLGYQPPEQRMVLEEWSTGVRASYNQTWANNTFAVFKNDFVGGSGGQMLTDAMSAWTPRISFAHAKSASFAAFTCGFGGGAKFWMDSLIVRNFRKYTKTIGAEQVKEKNQNWWNNSFDARYPINITTNNDAVDGNYTYKGTFDSASWQCDTNNNNLAVVWHQDRTQTELDAEIDGICGDSSDLNVNWKSKFGIPSNTLFISTDQNGYFIYTKKDGNRSGPPRSLCGVYGYCEDFEDGDYTSNPAWTIGDGTWSVQNSVAKNGSYSLKLTTAEGSGFYTAAEGDPGDWHYWIRNEDVSKDQSIQFKTAGSASTIFRIHFNGEKIRYWNSAYHDFSPAITPTNSEWYKVRFVYTAGNATGNVYVYDSSESLLGSATGVSVNVAGTMGVIELGSGDTQTKYWDDAIYGGSSLASEPTISIGERQSEGGSDSNLSRFQIRFFETAPPAFELETAKIDYNFSPYADATRIAPKGIPIAGWDENHLALIGWQNDCPQAKTLFFSLSLDALSTQDQNALLADSIEWLLDQNTFRPCTTNQPSPE